MSRPYTIHFLVAERDVDDPFRSNGAIIFEQYTHDDELAVEDRAKGLAKSGKYGRVWLGSVRVADLRLVDPEVSP